MTTNSRAILLQRAIRAEAAKRIADTQALTLQTALNAARSEIVKLKALNAVSLAALPDAHSVAVEPNIGAQVKVTSIRDAVYTEAGFRCPHTGQIFQPHAMSFWFYPGNGDD